MSGSSFFGFLNTIADKNKELMEINDNGLEFISNLKKTKESYEKLMTPYNKMEKDINDYLKSVPDFTKKIHDAKNYISIIYAISSLSRIKITDVLSKAKNNLGWKAKITFKELVKDMVDNDS